MRPFFDLYSNYTIHLIACNFSFRDHFFISTSLFNALLRVRYRSVYTSATGRRAFVYRAPLFVALCSCTRFSTSFVLPAYNVPSAHFTIYT